MNVVFLVYIKMTAMMMCMLIPLTKNIIKAEKKAEDMEKADSDAENESEEKAEEEVVVVDLLEEKTESKKKILFHLNLNLTYH